MYTFSKYCGFCWLIFLRIFADIGQWGPPEISISRKPPSPICRDKGRGQGYQFRMGLSCRTWSYRRVEMPARNATWSWLLMSSHPPISCLLLVKCSRKLVVLGAGEIEPPGASSVIQSKRGDGGQSGWEVGSPWSSAAQRTPSAPQMCGSVHLSDK